MDLFGLELAGVICAAAFGGGRLGEARFLVEKDEVDFGPVAATEHAHGLLVAAFGELVDAGRLALALRVHDLELAAELGRHDHVRAVSQYEILCIDIYIHTFIVLLNLDDFYLLFIHKYK